MRYGKSAAFFRGLFVLLLLFGVVRGQQAATGVPRGLYAADDGAALTIFYGGETRGSLDQCGCPRHPMGGLPRRMAFIGGYRELFSETPALDLSVGNIFNDQGVNSDPPFRDVIALNDHALRAYSRFQYDVTNLSHQDLRVIGRYYKTDRYKQCLAAFYFP